MQDDEYYMRQALREAAMAYDKGEVPVGAIVVSEGRIIGRGHNMVELLKDSTAHAEMIALTAAFNFLGSKYLPDATIYITLEPCLMCCGALFWSKLPRIVFGADDIKNGFRKTTGTGHPFHPRAEVVNGILADECAQLMKDFFKERR